MVYNNKNINATVWSVEWKHPVQSSTSHSLRSAQTWIRKTICASTDKF